MDAIRRYSRELDDWDPPDFVVSAAEIQGAHDSMDEEFKSAFALSVDATSEFARLQRSTLIDAEWEPKPGVVVGQKQVPLKRCGSYLPGGRYPLIASPLMTVLVPKVAGLERVVAGTPP